jgi:DNA-binding beta-propeller fold protein YncE
MGASTIEVSAANVTALTVDPATGRLYAISSSSVAVSDPDGFVGLIVVDPTARREIARVPLEPGMSFLQAEVDSWNHRVYTVDAFSTILFIVDTQTNKVIDQQDSPLQVGPYGVTVDEFTNRAYWVEANQITVLDGSTGRVLDEIPVDTQGALRDVAVNRADGTVYAVDDATDELFVIDPGSRSVKGKVHITGALNVSVNPVIGRVYVTVPDVNTIAVVDGLSQSVIGTLGAAGTATSRVEVNENTNTLYVPNGQTIDVLDGDTERKIGSISAAGGALAVDPVRGLVYAAAGDQITVNADRPGLPAGGGAPGRDPAAPGWAFTVGLISIISGLGLLALTATRSRKTN